MAQPAPTARQCTAVLTGVLIRHGIPITESLTADLTAAVTSREAALVECMADRARTRADQVLVHNARAQAYRDGLNDASAWLGRAATAAARRDHDATQRQRALQRPPLSGPVATVTTSDTPTAPSRGGAQSA